MGGQENPISQNRYTYVWNSPNKYVDKSGHDLLVEGTDNNSYHVNEINKLAALRGISYAEAEKIYWSGKSGESEDEYNQEKEESNKRYEEKLERDRQRAAAAEAARIEALEAEWAEAQRIADEYGLNITTNMDGWTLDEKIAYLREVIRICEKLANGKISVEDAQEEVNALIPKPGAQEGIATILLKSIRIIIAILDFAFFWVPVIGGFIGILNSLWTLFEEGIGWLGKNLVDATLSIVAFVAEVIAGIATAGASFGTGMVAKLLAKGLDLIKMNKKLIEFSVAMFDLADNAQAIIDLYSLGNWVITFTKTCIGGLSQIWE